jgi:predicted transcriptional regulator
MSQTPSGTVLTATIDIFKDLLTSGNRVDAEKLGELITDVGDRLLNLKNKEEGIAPVQTTAKAASVQATAAPEPTTVEASKPAETPVAAPEVVAQQTPKQATGLGTARGRKKAAQAEMKRKPGRPKGSGRKAEETDSTEVLTGEIITPEDQENNDNIADTQQETAAEVTQDVTNEAAEVVFDNPDPKAPNYKFKHLLDRFGVNPDGSAKRFNNMTEEETFDGELVISLFDGVTRKMLKRRLGREYGMTDKEYVIHFGLSPDYRPVGKDFSASKSVDAKKTKLGHKKEGEEVQETAEQPPIATPAKAERRTRARSKQAA